MIEGIANLKNVRIYFFEPIGEHLIPFARIFSRRKQLAISITTVGSVIFIFPLMIVSLFFFNREENL